MAISGKKLLNKMEAMEKKIDKEERRRRRNNEIVKGCKME